MSECLIIYIVLHEKKEITCINNNVFNYAYYRLVDQGIYDHDYPLKCVLAETEHVPLDLQFINHMVALVCLTYVDN